MMDVGKSCATLRTAARIYNTQHTTLFCLVCVIVVRSVDEICFYEQHDSARIICRHRVQHLLQKRVVRPNLLWHEGSVRILNNGSQGSCSCDSTQLVRRGQ